MNTWIALLRGINVGGAHRLPMAELRAQVSGLGLVDVATCIASGNVVFGAKGDGDAADAETLSGRIEATIETHHGFRPRVLVLSAGEFRRAMEANPFPEGEPEPKTLHVYFLAEQPAADLDPSALDGLASPTERWELGDRVLYLHAPEGIGRSKLAARVEALLGVPATARNWRTVTRVWEMVRERQAGG